MKRSHDYLDETSKNPLVRNVWGYHPGNWTGEPKFKILLVSGNEARCLRDHSVPVTDLTDPTVQLYRARRVNRFVHLGGIARMRSDLTGYVQDTDGARDVLKTFQFSERSPHVNVRPDPKLRW